MQTLIIFIVNMIQYPHTLKNIYISNNRGPPTFFHSYTNTVLDAWSILLTKPVLVVTVSGIDLVVVLEHNFFQLCSYTEQIS